MTDRFRVFLSAVSSEFGAVRAQLRSDLTARGLEVKEQADFRQEAGADTTLAKLHDYIRDCDAVVSLVGTRSGAMPPAAADEPFRAMLLPTGMQEASYTQWEVIFARAYGKRLSFYVAGSGWVPDRDASDGDRPDLQAALRAWLFDRLGLDRKEGLHHPGDLRAEVLKEEWPDLRKPKPVHLRFRSIGSLFKGRQSKMAELRARLSGPGGGRVAVTSRPQAVHGLGGIGKTRLAVEYGLAHEGEYSALLFASGETPAQLDSDIAALAGVLALPEADATEDEVRIRAALGWLRAHDGWLLVLDNLDTPAAMRRAEELLAHLSKGHVVATTRLSNLSGFFEPLQLDVLAEADAVEFLLDRTAARRRLAEDDRAQAAAMARDLDGLALALEQAGAFICQRRLTLAGYRAEWAARRDKVLAWFGAGVTDYPRSVAVTWLTSVEQLTPAGRRMLERLAFLAPEPVPEFLLEVAVPGVEGDDPHAALADLEGYSLVTRGQAAPVFVAHRVVQAVTRQSLAEEAAAKALAEALGWINAAFEGDPEDVRVWPRLDPLLPHALAVTATANAAELADPTARLLNEIGNLLRFKTRLAEAEPLLRRALAIDEARHGADHPKVLIRLNDLAGLLQDTHRLSEAEPMMRRALAIAEASHGLDHPEVAIVLGNLAELLQHTNRLSEAEPMMRRALAIDEASYGAGNAMVAVRLNNLAFLLWNTNRMAEVEPMMRRALAIVEASYGADHPRVASLQGNFAHLLQATNRLGEAEPMMRRALAIDEASYGPDHPQVAVRLGNLAVLLLVTSRLAEAEPMIRRAIAIDEASYGADHPNVAIGLNNLARLLQAANRLAEAAPMMRRVLDTLVASTRATGHQHPYLRAAIGNHASLLKSLGYPKALIDRRVREALAPIAHILARQPPPP